MLGAAKSMLHVCTWNINLGLRLGEVLEAVSSHADFARLDLFALQEASVHDGRPDGRTIAAALGPDYDCHQVTAQIVKGHVQANAMVWNKRRVEVKTVGHLNLPRGERAKSPQQRNSVVVQAEAAHASVLAYSVHLDISGLTHKHRQLTSVLEDGSARPAADITIVAGDLNVFQVARWPSWAKLVESYEAAGFVDASRSVRWTHSMWPLPIRQKLDSILVRSSRELDLRSWTLPVRGSDHIPLFAEITAR
jgi:endonuclease/exonuclease/phosphatase family metal-dependent hydrolase